ncbi:ATP-binding protein [Spartinivicinus marinus]|uniref:ATP-binding protein n=1 Tax=Spartinivicinus marinus TaxID=2994442 RepID=UPI0022539068|nr:ATP-binding protein [Spartinivicinus marinus]MCX4027879.1 ATP-binding protein [Spartinivicinus marinus]
MAISLASISKTNGIKAPRILIYGTHGIGKTTFAAGAPNPIFLFTEDGAGQLELNSFPLLTSYFDVIQALAALYNEEHNFQTVVLDSLDHLEPLIWSHTAQQCNKDSIEDFGYGKGYMEALRYWREILGWLDALRNQKGMIYILTAHTHIKRFDSPETDSYDRYQIKLNDKASGLVQESVDCVLFCNYQVNINKADVGFGKEKARGISTGQRLIHTVEKPAYIAKNRFNLPEKMPLSWEAFTNALNPQPSV